MTLTHALTIHVPMVGDVEPKKTVVITANVRRFDGKNCQIGEGQSVDFTRNLTFHFKVFVFRNENL